MQGRSMSGLSIVTLTAGVFIGPHLIKQQAAAEHAQREVPVVRAPKRANKSMVQTQPCSCHI